MIDIVGGVYLERCIRPPWSQLYGSGGRAAAALGGRTKVRLHTLVNAANTAAARARAATFEYEIVIHDSPRTIAFDYVHPLAVPYVIRPAPTASLEIEAPVALAFGMMEADVKVRGGRVTYDPQSATEPKLFRANGSTADELALVANGYEAKLMTGEGDPVVAAQRLLEREHAAVVALKLGTRGAMVVQPGGTTTPVPAYASSHVFSIGSGDVFAATFAFLWGEQQFDPVEAAVLASKSTCRYCDTVSLPIPTPEDLRQSTPPVAAVRPGRAYLAGPFFSLTQQWLVEEARMHLMALGVDVFSPLHEVGVGAGRDVAKADLAGLDGCDRVFAIIDGLDPGTLFEVGYAVAKGIPVFALAESVPPEALKMIEGSGCTVIDDFTSAVYRTCWRQ